MKYAIVAYDKNRVMGGDNKMPWQGEMKTDVRRFYKLTVGNFVVMGRRTFDSIGSPLPNRQNIIISRQNIKIDGALVVANLDAAYAAARDKDVYVIGGGQIFEQSLTDIDRILATEIKASFNGDVYFPELSNDWVEVSRKSYAKDSDNNYDYDFVDYIKRQSAL